MKLTYYGKVLGGKLILPRRRIAKEMQQFEGKAVAVTIERKKNIRSSPQNRYYWGVLLKHLTQALQYEMPDTIITKQLVHDLMKEKFLPVVKGDKERVVVQSTGEVLEVPYSTTKLTTTEMMHYKDLIQAWAAELGIILPDPHEDWGDLVTDIDKEI